MWKTTPSSAHRPYRPRVLRFPKRVYCLGKVPPPSTRIHGGDLRKAMRSSFQHGVNDAFPVLRKGHPESSSCRLRTRFRNSASLAISASTLFTEWITVEWSRSPKSSPILV